MQCERATPDVSRRIVLRSHVVVGADHMHRCMHTCKRGWQPAWRVDAKPHSAVAFVPLGAGGGCKPICPPAHETPLRDSNDAEPQLPLDTAEMCCDVVRAIRCTGRRTVGCRRIVRRYIEGFCDRVGQRNVSAPRETVRRSLITI